MIKIYTSKEVLKLFHDENGMYELCFDRYCHYELTEGEIEWLEFTHKKYSIADYIGKLYRNALITSGLNNSACYIRIDFMHASTCMDADCHGMGKAVMLSDDTALQALLFMNYVKGENLEDYK